MTSSHAGERLTGELEPIAPEEAIEMYLSDQSQDLRKSSLDTHRSALNFFEQWCAEQEIDNLNELTGRQLHSYRIWRREEAPRKTDTLAKSTEKTQQKVIRQFIRYCGQIDAVALNLHEKVRVPSIKKGDAARSNTVEPDQARKVIQWLSDYKYASLEHVTWLLLADTGARIGTLQSLDCDDYHPREDPPYLEANHRPDTGTGLKNGKNGERLIALSQHVCDVIDDYLGQKRPDVTDEFGRKPLFHRRILSFTSSSARSLNHYLPTAVVIAGCGKGLIASSGSTLWDYAEDVPPSEDESEDSSQEESPSEDNHDWSEKCVLMYLRVSTNEQKENGRSLESQEDELTSIIQADPDIRSFTAEPIRDEGETGTDFDREGIRRVGELAQEDEVTHLFVDTIDRIGRSVAETMMFIQNLRNKCGVRLKTRNREFDVRKPTDKMQVTMLAAMADFGTMNRARSAHRSSVDNFIKENSWKSWFPMVPIGYEMSGDWIQPIDELKPMIQDIYRYALETENYSEVARKINGKYEEEIEHMDRDYTDSITSQQIRAILSRPVYKGEPTVPVTSLEHYDANPSVKDSNLRIVSDETFEKAEKLLQRTSEKYSSNSDTKYSPADFAEEFDPFTVETVSPIVQLDCPKCTSRLTSNGQYEIDGDFASRMYNCSNSDCDYSRRWPHESEREMMNMLAKLDGLHSLL